MPICKNCNNKWSWKQTIKRSSSFKREMICPYCGEKQYQSKKSQAIAPFSSLVVLLPLFIQSFFDVSVGILLGLIPILAATVFMMYPFFIKLSSKEEYFFD